MKLEILNERLARLMDKSGLKKGEFYRWFGYSAPAFSLFMNGEREPSVDFLRTLEEKENELELGPAKLEPEPIRESGFDLRSTSDEMLESMGDHLHQEIKRTTGLDRIRRIELLDKVNAEVKRRTSEAIQGVSSTVASAAQAGQASASAAAGLGSQGSSHSHKAASTTYNKPAPKRDAGKHSKHKPGAQGPAQE